MSSPVHRPVRSFVKREGRMTKSQIKALDELMPVHGITNLDQPLNLDQLFPRKAPRFIEIGFGMGASLIQMAQTHPERDYIGIEVHRPGVGSTLHNLQALELSNLKIINHDAVEVLKQSIPENSIDGIYLFFPDPWHKTKHKKRRILKTDFVHLIQKALKDSGVFHMATDWEDYASHMMAVMTSETCFINHAGDKQYAPRGDRPETKYERRGQRLGHGVWDLVFYKKSNDSE
ncbi:MAG: tRNA (guanosine(46)-N7)-methyltransferase TrmB [Gammaproteobacteria bacterium]|nr:tRNA (guanosine(46)-N7)-methyltransferase TrmB [Gammaproteobacteria bacterium]